MCRVVSTLRRFVGVEVGLHFLRGLALRLTRLGEVLGEALNRVAESRACVPGLSLHVLEASLHLQSIRAHLVHLAQRLVDLIEQRALFFGRSAGEPRREHLAEDGRASRPTLQRRRRQRWRDDRSARGGDGRRDAGPAFGRERLQLFDHRVRVDVPILGLLRQQAKDELLEAPRALGREIRGLRRRLLHVLDEEARQLLRLEGDAPGEHLEEDRAERVEVRRGPRVDARDALGGHVLRRPEDLALVRQAAVVHRARDPEVEQLHLHAAGSSLAYEDVLGLEVAVDHLEVMGARQALRDLQSQRGHAPGFDGPLRDVLREGRALQQLHHQEHRAILDLAVVVDLDDVRVRQRRRVLRLAPEPLAQPFVARHRRAHDLHRDGSVHQRVARAVDRRHPAMTDLFFHEIATGQRRPDVRVIGDVELGGVDEAPILVVRVLQTAGGTDLHFSGATIPERVAAACGT